MDLKGKVILFVGALSALAILWLFHQNLGNWTDVALLFAGIAVAQLVLVGSFFLIGGMVYAVALYQANRYARLLRDAGYQVSLERGLVKEFSIATIITLVMGPLAVWLASSQYKTYVCIKAERCFEPGFMWYAFAVGVPLIFVLVAIVSLRSALIIWRDSFRPLKGHWEKVRRGVGVKLERMPAITRIK